jgi:phosphonate transport system substrate-binding protein
LKKYFFKQTFIILLIVLVFITGCSEKKNYLEISMSDIDAEQMNKAKNQQTLMFAVAIGTSPTITRQLSLELVEYLTKELGNPVELVLRQSYAEIKNLMMAGEVDFGLVSPSIYVLSDAEQLEMLGAAVFNGDLYNKKMLLTSFHNPVDVVAELRGKTIAYSDPWSASGSLFLKARIFEMGETSQTFFENYFYTYSFEKSLGSVLTGLADVAVINSIVLEILIENGMVSTNRLHFVKETFTIPNWSLVVRTDLDAETKDSIRDAFFNMNNTPNGIAVLQKLHLDGFINAKEDFLYSIKKIAEQVLYHE